MDAVNSHLIKVTTDTLYLALLALPGYWVGVALIDRIGRRRLQLFGFGMMSGVFAVMAGTLSHLQSNRALFFFVYGLSFFFSNCGPNLTTFVVPSELYPTRVRATLHGLSAALGKAGAVVGGAAMPALLDATSLDRVLYLNAGLSVLGLVVTYLFLEETMGRDLNGPTTHHTATSGSAGAFSAPSDGDAVPSEAALPPPQSDDVWA